MIRNSAPHRAITRVDLGMKDLTTSALHAIQAISKTVMGAVLVRNVLPVNFQARQAQQIVIPVQLIRRLRMAQQSVLRVHEARLSKWHPSTLRMRVLKEVTIGVLK